ncbi:MAG: 3-hydroxyacyl-CoA dehydrogenase [Methylococcaceae bacterium]|nr:3-hydroxyacyl-CoA dehydrogenase [Methylococcaceae bacterium]
MSIQKVAVIGAGVMGAGIAAQCANAGLGVVLLDIVPKDPAVGRNSLVEAALAKLLKADPPAFMHPKAARLITIGNIEDHLELLRDVDWVIEAVLEDLAIKQALYQKLLTVCGDDTLISSNTSTIPLKLLTQNLPDSFKQRFMITHFFNPPRYMRLLELVQSTVTRQDLVAAVTHFADVQLGKGCVCCHDTPGFIANRIGTFWMQTAMLNAVALNLSVEQADAAMSLLGIPKTGIFGLLDLVGLDLIPHILGSFKQLLPATDALHAITDITPIMQKMLNEGYTGRKGKGGFYRLQTTAGQRIKEAINLQTGDYRVSEKVSLPALPTRQDDLRTWLSQDTPINRYVWQVLSKTLAYSASLIPEIADDYVAIDRAMRLGYNWQHGPFELLDLIGVAWFTAQLMTEDRTVPALLSQNKPIYQITARNLTALDLSGQYQPIVRAPGMLLLSDIKRAKPAVLHNASASLWDIGDGVACLEFHSKMNTLDRDSLLLIRQSIEKVSSDFKALVIYNDADNFSAGANLTLLVTAIHQRDWLAVEELIRQGQQTYAALKYAPFPVVGAPSGLALGGGCEVLLHCDAIQAHAELYMGLVEVGVGLVPGWGGCKEYLRRWLSFSKRPGGAMPAIAQVFETIGMAKVSKSAAEAKELLFLAASDGISMNKERLLADAKTKALALVSNYHAQEPAVFQLPGESAKAAMALAIHNFHLAGKISAYDVEISLSLADVLSGGICDITLPLTETTLLNLELQAFVHLVKQAGTVARLEHLLATGKPLRN